MHPRRTSVLYFSNTMARGGAEEHILTLLRGLDRGRFRPLLACTPEVARKLAPDLPADVPVTELHLRRPGDAGAALNLARLIRRERIDVLHSHLFYSSLFASPVGWLCHVPLIVETPHVREHWRQGVKAHFVVDRLASRFVDQYIAVSEANRRYLIQEKGLPPHKIVVIANGCDVRRFNPSHDAPSGMREQLGLGKDDPILVVVGRLEPQKGHRVLIEAMTAIRARHPRVRLICVGEGALRDHLQSLVTATGLVESVRFVGQQPNVVDWLRLSDVVILPSLYEGLPLAAIESLAAGRAMVASAVDGTPEVIVDGETGLTVPPGDAAALAEAICRLLDNPGLRTRLASAGRAWVVEHFSDHRQIARTETLYQMALHRRGHRVFALAEPTAMESRR